MNPSLTSMVLATLPHTFLNISTLGTAPGTCMSHHISSIRATPLSLILQSRSMRLLLPRCLHPHRMPSLHSAISCFVCGEPHSCMDCPHLSGILANESHLHGLAWSLANAAKLDCGPHCPAPCPLQRNPPCDIHQLAAAIAAVTNGDDCDSLSDTTIPLPLGLVAREGSYIDTPKDEAATSPDFWLACKQIHIILLVKGFLMMIAGQCLIMLTKASHGCLLLQNWATSCQPPYWIRLTLLTLWQPAQYTIPVLTISWRNVALWTLFSWLHLRRSVTLMIIMILPSVSLPPMMTSYLTHFLIFLPTAPTWNYSWLVQTRLILPPAPCIMHNI